MAFVKGHTLNKGKKLTEAHKKALREARRLGLLEGRIKPARGMLGKKQSEETRKKISANHKSKNPENNKKFSETMKRLYRDGLIKKTVRKWTEAHRQKFTESILRTYDKKGRKTRLNKLLRNRIESHKWRIAVFTRDNWTCQACRARGVYIEAHHIKSWAKHPELRTILDNGVTLCKPCHKLTDNYAGKTKRT